MHEIACRSDRQKWREDTFVSSEFWPADGSQRWTFTDGALLNRDDLHDACSEMADKLGRHCALLFLCVKRECLDCCLPWLLAAVSSFGATTLPTKVKVLVFFATLGLLV